MRSKLCVTRSLFLSACLVAASATGCGGTPDASSRATPVETAVPTPHVEATNEPVANADAAAAPAPDAVEGGHHHRRHGPFVDLEAMDLNPDQRTKVDAIRGDVQATFDAIHRDGRELALALAASIDGGRLDVAAVREKRLAFEARVAAARVAFADAANAVHGTLDPAQRTELVLTLRAKREGRSTPKELAAEEATGERKQHEERGVSRLASELGLSADQTRALHDGARAIVDAAFPDRKARREKAEAEIKAAEEAFMTNTFDAHRYELGKDASEWVDTASKGATALSDLAASVLTQSQRAALAQKIREGAGER